jgi:hypothetical protein
MKKVCLLIGFFYLSNNTFSQKNKYTIDIRVGELRYEKDSVSFTSTPLITTVTDGITPIFPIGKSKNYEYGMKIEFLKSQFFPEYKYIVGTGYYIKRNGKWEEITSYFRPEDVYRFSERKKYNNNDNLLAGVSGEDPYYEIRIRYDFFDNSK